MTINLICWKVVGTVCIEIKGDRFVKSAVLQNKKTGEKKEVPADGIFVSFGTVPTSGIAKDLGINIDKAGYIEVERDQKTNVPGVFAAGEIQDSYFRQIATSVGQGCAAAMQCEKWLSERE